MKTILILALICLLGSIVAAALFVFYGRMTGFYHCGYCECREECKQARKDKNKLDPCEQATWKRLNNVRVFRTAKERAFRRTFAIFLNFPLAIYGILKCLYSIYMWLVDKYVWVYITMPSYAKQHRSK